ncbi:MAG: HAD hydrolase family protein [Candidatus Magasanikbacteria bacterium]
MTEEGLLLHRKQISDSKLVEAKPLIKLFGLDYDGTIADGKDYTIKDAVALIGQILLKGKSVAFVTARAATAIKTFIPPLEEFFIKNKISTPIYIGGGNGIILYEFKNNELKKIYSHGLTVDKISHAIDVWQKVYDQFNINTGLLSEKGLDTFRKFLKDDWEGLIPKDIYQLCLPFGGQIFTEEAKFTFVLPADQSVHQEIITAVRVGLGKSYQVSAGDTHFAHITKALHEDSKMVAIKTILKTLNLELNQVATFGDMPNGNDAGLLSFPYSFTNDQNFVNQENELSGSPYILCNQDMSPVSNVYVAINYLLS